MSGTPVENRLSELWSIMDFSNRGLLGSEARFSERFGRPIQQFSDPAAAGLLRRVCAPFLMRRMKTDRAIISDLPEKIEMDCYARLTPTQAALYQKTLDSAMKAIAGVSGKGPADLFTRQGLVLQMILALKQICNHPAQFLKNGREDPALSGKSDLLFDKLDGILSAEEKVLVFTQFTEMGNLLAGSIRERYGREPLFYHGGLSLKARKEVVSRFQDDPEESMLILSIKAGGTGLNLTGACHVVHYDLWWNPAVEAQATDRAFRIGQRRDVFVHRLIMKDTFEERINEMIRRKRDLAELTVASGEQWIGQLSNEQLEEVFRMA
jgi:SNF2 family DNA or RNA helicase